MEAREKNEILFTQLVLMFHAATMQQLGKIKHPLSGKVERDLVAAQQSIEILDMLKEKTRGNLSSDEERFLTNMIKELKLNYVDEVNKPEPATAETQTPPAPESEQKK